MVCMIVHLRCHVEVILILGQVCINQSFSEVNLYVYRQNPKFVKQHTFGLAYKKKLPFGQVLFIAIVMLVIAYLELATALLKLNRVAMCLCFQSKISCI